MSKQAETIERLIEELLKDNEEISTARIINHIIKNIGNRRTIEEIEDATKKVIESMADRMKIIETPSGKWWLNQ